MARTREQLVDRLAEIAAASVVDLPEEGGILLLDPEEAALLVEALEPRPPAFEGWADVELMGHRSRIAYVREIELARRGFIDLAWTDGGDVTRREIYATSAVFSLTPLDNEAAAVELRAARLEASEPW